MNPGADSGGTYAAEVLATLASGLSVDATESGRKALEVVRARSPELIAIGEQTGEDLVTTSAGFIDMMLAALRNDSFRGPSRARRTTTRSSPWRRADSRTSPSD
ncbi:MAG: hypothetical protein E6J08_05305 [Chloroflexi bacterium]|nr:MAG: hypothetical protein E6J08_05305 [Chloroflexota bacterium]